MQQKGELNKDDYISIMTDPDLHPLPITPNDPLSIVSIFPYHQPIYSFLKSLFTKPSKKIMILKSQIVKLILILSSIQLCHHLRLVPTREIFHRTSSRSLTRREKSCRTTLRDRTVEICKDRDIQAKLCHRCQTS